MSVSILGSIPNQDGHCVALGCYPQKSTTGSVHSELLENACGSHGWKEKGCMKSKKKRKEREERRWEGKERREMGGKKKKDGQREE